MDIKVLPTNSQIMIQVFGLCSRKPVPKKIQGPIGPAQRLTSTLKILHPTKGLKGKNRQTKHLQQ
uniref:Uncharacterized protein n=1 Tax=Lepeophtheirus salmonis TaxID=72036 RepID=A0A0K2TSW1_LEPSM